MTTMVRPLRPSWRDACRVTGRIQPGRRGPWEVRTIEIGDHDLANLRLMFQPGGRSTRPGTYTQLVHDRRGIVMSDTDAEIRDLASLFWRPPRGRILVNGLGLGCVVHGLLALDDVTHVDVVEVDADVIGLVGSQITDPRVTIHHADAFTIEWPRGTTWDGAWHDVWDSLNTDNLSSPDAVPGSYAALNRRYARRTTWQAAWGQQLLKARRDQERRSGWW